LPRRRCALKRLGCLHKRGVALRPVSALLASLSQAAQRWLRGDYIRYSFHFCLPYLIGPKILISVPTQRYGLDGRILDVQGHA
jgi:hypothetical protein